MGESAHHRHQYGRHDCTGATKSHIFPRKSNDIHDILWEVEKHRKESKPWNVYMSYMFIVSISLCLQSFLPQIFGHLSCCGCHLPGVGDCRATARGLSGSVGHVLLRPLRLAHHRSTAGFGAVHWLTDARFEGTRRT